MKSLPSRGRGLKHYWLEWAAFALSIAPFAGARIETCVSGQRAEGVRYRSLRGGAD